MSHNLSDYSLSKMSSNQDSSSVYIDLVQFLKASRADLKLEATKAVLQVVSDRYVFLESCLFSN
jgi:hypothetical protein